MILGFLILSLLFSVGEGVRLSPFTTVNTPDALSVPTHREDSAFAPGSAAQNQARKRNKGHHTDFELPQSVKVVDAPVFESAAIEQHSVVQDVSTQSRFTRGPPSK